MGYWTRVTPAMMCSPTALIGRPRSRPNPAVTGVGFTEAVGPTTRCLRRNSERTTPRAGYALVSSMCSGRGGRAPGGRIVRTIGVVRARAKIGLQNLAFNIRRTSGEGLGSSQSDDFLIVLMAFAGPRHPKNFNVFASRAFVASKNFSNSFIAREGSRRMSCRSPSKGDRSGTTNTRSFRSFLPFDDCRTSSTPMGLHVSTRPGYVAAS